VAGSLILDERLTWYQPVGALVVLSGIAYSTGSTSTPEATIERSRLGGPTITSARADRSPTTVNPWGRSRGTKMNMPGSAVHSSSSQKPCSVTRAPRQS
jgi:hypothetical protein